MRLILPPFDLKCKSIDQIRASKTGNNPAPPHLTRSHLTRSRAHLPRFGRRIGPARSGPEDLVLDTSSGETMASPRGPIFVYGAVLGAGVMYAMPLVLRGIQRWRQCLSMPEWALKMFDDEKYQRVRMREWEDMGWRRRNGWVGRDLIHNTEGQAVRILHYFKRGSDLLGVCHFGPEAESHVCGCTCGCGGGWRITYTRYSCSNLLPSHRPGRLLPRRCNDLRF